MWVKCPACIKLIEIAPSSIPVRPPSATVLPETREYDPAPSSIRGKAKESWEVRGADLREIEFKDQLAKTSDFQKIRSPNVIRKKKRRYHHEKPDEVTGWEHKRSHRQPSWRVFMRSVRKLPLISITILIAAFCGVSYKIYTWQHKYRSQKVYTPTPPPPPKQHPSERELELSPLSTVMADLKPALQKFLNAATAEDLLHIIRQPEIDGPLMDNYYKSRQPFSKVDCRAMPTIENLFTYKNFATLSLENSQFNNFMVTFERTPQGFLLDWPSYVGYGEMTLAELQAKKPKDPVLLRLILKRNSYYNFEFADQKSFQSYEMTTIDRELVIYGYAARGMKENTAITSHLRSKPLLFCVLKVKYPENSTSNRQVEIVEYLQTGWVIRGEDIRLFAPEANNLLHAPSPPTPTPSATPPVTPSLSPDSAPTPTPTPQ